MGMVYERDGASTLSNDDALPEFDEFLAQIGYGHLYRGRRHTQECEAVSAPENALRTVAGPATALVAPHETPRFWFRLSVGLTLMLVAASVAGAFWVPLQRVLFSTSRAAQASPAQRQASPFFAMERFDALQPGATVAEVRDHLGVPQIRRTRAGADAREDWCYLAPSGTTKDSRLLCTVALQAGKVLSTRKVAMTEWVSSTGPGTVAGVLRPGDLRFQWKDGREDVVTGSNPKPQVLVCASAGLSPEYLAGLSVPVRRIARENSAPAQEEWDGATVSIARNGKHMPLPSVSVFWRGFLFLLPQDTPDTPESTRQADVEWLLKHLPTVKPSALLPAA